MGAPGMWRWEARRHLWRECGSGVATGGGEVSLRLGRRVPHVPPRLCQMSGTGIQPVAALHKRHNLKSRGLSRALHLQALARAEHGT